MKFTTIFADNYLHSVIFENDKDEFRRAFDNWFNVEYLMEFFETHSKDLKSGFFGDLQNSAATIITINEAKRLQSKFKQISLLKGKSQKDAIDSLFVPLDNRTAHDLRTKAKGDNKKSWLRIYALKYDNTIIVTGSAIKLTETMNDREHLSDELGKLRRVKDFLTENGVSDAEGFTELISEI